MIWLVCEWSAVTRSACRGGGAGSSARRRSRRRKRSSRRSAARIGRVILLVDRSAFDLEEEAVLSSRRSRSIAFVRHEPSRLGSLLGRLPVLQLVLGNAVALESREGPVHSVVMLLALKRPRTGRFAGFKASSWVAVVMYLVTLTLRRLDNGLAVVNAAIDEAAGRVEAVAAAAQHNVDAWWSTVCSAIEPRPAFAFVSFGQIVRMSFGPWQPRRQMCEFSTAGVASVISAVETLPTSLPLAWRDLENGPEVPAGDVDIPARTLGDAVHRSSSCRWPTSCRWTPNRGRSRARSSGRCPASPTRWSESRCTGSCPCASGPQRRTGSSAARVTSETPMPSPMKRMTFFAPWDLPVSPVMTVLVAADREVRGQPQQDDCAQTARHGGHALTCRHGPQPHDRARPPCERVVKRVSPC